MKPPPTPAAANAAPAPLAPGEPVEPAGLVKAEDPSAAEVAEENVMQVVRLGYTLNGRLLRPASVIVSSGPAASDQKA